MRCAGDDGPLHARLHHDVRLKLLVQLLLRVADAVGIWLSLHDFSRIGDVVKYINSSRPMEQGNGYTDWNIPWKQWLKGSALST